MQKARKASNRAQAIKFGKINRSALKMKDASKRTRTGAFKTKCRVPAH